MDNKPIKKTVCSSDSPNGDLTSLEVVFNWLKLFAQQIAPKTTNEDAERPPTSPTKTILVANSYVYLKLCVLGQKEPGLVEEINQFMREKNISFLFYPTENATAAEPFQIPIIDNLLWKLVGEYSLRASPNSHLAFVQVLRQAMREIVCSSKRIEIRNWFLRFAEMAEIQAYVGELMPEVVEPAPPPPLPPSAIQSQQSMDTERELKRQDSKASLFDAASQDSNCPSTPLSTTSSTQPPVKLTESEVQEYCEWVDEMSKIGKQKSWF